ncbi:MAG: hypothetical protein HYY84_20355 [Deltaproteobacteria bacterium]|nr:hypothetical protein [Deltaproteobacteria bacterium]
MTDKREPPKSEIPPPGGGAEPQTPALDAIRAKLGALRKSLDAKPDEGANKAAIPVAEPPALPPPLPGPAGPPPAPALSAPAPAPASTASAPAPAFASESTTVPAPTDRDTGETRDAAKTDPRFEVPFTLLRPKAPEPTTPSTDPGRSLGTAPAPPPPPPITDDSSSEVGATPRSARRPWIISAAAMIPVTGFLCFLAYYVGNARLRGDRISDAKETIQAARTAAEASHRAFQAMAIRIKRTHAASVDARTKRWTRIDWSEWEAIRATVRPAALADVLGVKRIDRLGAVAVKHVFDYHAKVVEFFRTAATTAAGMLSRRADFEKALADPDGAFARTSQHRYAVVTRAPAGDSGLNIGEVVVVRRIVPRAPAARGTAGDGARVEVVKLSGSNEKPALVAEDDLVTLLRSDVIRLGHELLREFAEQVKRLERLAVDVEDEHRLLVVELDRLSK